VRSVVAAYAALLHAGYHMIPDDRFSYPSFPRTSAYDPEWIIAGVSGGANPLWMTEWLTDRLDLKRGMRVLDLGCGRASSSIFLHRSGVPGHLRGWWTRDMLCLHSAPWWRRHWERNKD